MVGGAGCEEMAQGSNVYEEGKAGPIGRDAVARVICIVSIEVL